MSRLLILLSIPVLAFAQTASEVVMTISMDNVMAYYDVGAGYARTGALADRTALPADWLFPFQRYIWLGDVVEVNGFPAKGTLFMPGMALAGGPNPAARAPIYDSARNQVAQAQIDILDTNSGVVGTICMLLLGAGPAPPGSPRTAGAGAFAVVGGSGAYLGATGHGGTASNVNFRSAPMTEDPGRRRINGGGQWRIALLLTGLKRPEIAAAYHAAGFAPVTEAAPARPGETLILAMRGMGPTRPALEPGQVFVEDPLQNVAGPVTVTVNGRAADCPNRAGWPTTADLYRVDVTLPGGLDPGKAALVVNRAYLPGVPFEIPVR